MFYQNRQPNEEIQAVLLEHGVGDADYYCLVPLIEWKDQLNPIKTRYTMLLSVKRVQIAMVRTTLNTTANGPDVHINVISVIPLISWINFLHEIRSSGKPMPSWVNTLADMSPVLIGLMEKLEIAQDKDPSDLWQQQQEADNKNTLEACWKIIGKTTQWDSDKMELHHTSFGCALAGTIVNEMARAEKTKGFGMTKDWGIIASLLKQ